MKLGPINSLSSQLNDPHFMHGTKLVKFSLILSQGQRTKVVDKKISLYEINLIAACLLVNLISAADRWIVENSGSGRFGGVTSFFLFSH